MADTNVTAGSSVATSCTPVAVVVGPALLTRTSYRTCPFASTGSGVSVTVTVTSGARCHSAA